MSRNLGRRFPQHFKGESQATQQSAHSSASVLIQFTAVVDAFGKIFPALESTYRANTLTLNAARVASPCQRQTPSTRANIFPSQALNLFSYNQSYYESKSKSICKVGDSLFFHTFVFVYFCHPQGDHTHSLAFELSTSASTLRQRQTFDPGLSFEAQTVTGNRLLNNLAN